MAVIGSPYHNGNQGIKVGTYGKPLEGYDVACDTTACSSCTTTSVAIHNDVNFNSGGQKMLTLTKIDVINIWENIDSLIRNLSVRKYKQTID